MDQRGESKMKNMTLANIAAACGGELIFPAEEPYANGRVKADYERLTIAGVVTDNRQVERDFLFIPFVGEKVDAHRFIPQAFEQGAACSLSEEDLTDPVGPCIRVESSQRALMDIAAYYRRQLKLPLVGIIGSVGKTSTKEMVASVLSRHYSVLKTEGNFNNEIGMPMTVLKIRDHHQVAVVEMGIDNFGQMSALAAVARPNIVVITNIGEAHLEFMKTRDGILASKTEVFDYLADGASVILNGDDDHLNCIRRAGGARIIFYGLGVDSSAAAREKDKDKLARLNGQIAEHLAKAKDRDGLADGCFDMSAAYTDQERLARETYRAENLSALGMDGVSASFITPEGDFEAVIPIPGEHNVYNALAAAAVGQSLGLDLDEIKAGMETASTISGRAHFLHLGGLTLIDDCYNANPSSMRASLAVLARAKGRRIAVLGDMGELGENAPAMHYELGERAAEEGIDMLYAAGALGREIARGASDASLNRREDGAFFAEEGEGVHRREKPMEIYAYPDRDALLTNLLGRLKEGDIVLVKASHFMGFEEVVKAIQESYGKGDAHGRDKE